METDEEVEEGALLGESTLAKLSATRKPEEIAAESAPSLHEAHQPQPEPAGVRRAADAVDGGCRRARAGGSRGRRGRDIRRRGRR